MITPEISSRPNDRFCRRCHHRLPKEPRRCPNCGLRFDPDRPETYSSHGRLVASLPAACLGVFYAVAGLAFFGVCGELGAAAFLALPAGFGFAAGYFGRAKLLLLVFFLLALAATAGTALFTLELSGAFWVLIGFAILAAPAIVGLVLGVLLRKLIEVRWPEMRNEAARTRVSEVDGTRYWSPHAP